ncbi:hypothetical protein FE783_00055 [Paenibacillus mesophilus]|uniref:hypothetical protein n=1 Tax=Paenibacillus mesophilus TaxID=2582849 RepID=UPI00110EC177|nr:hypothetical protein [Paenibacillus mesophilus]TMV52628.1 hypothetical protein FE783_00055 [Paenibacillus mesophilus]
MDKLKDLREHVDKFIADQITEEEYINKHDSAKGKENAWYEIKDVFKIKEKWSKFVRKTCHPGNRRKFLAESVGITYNELRRLTGWGNSTVGDLLRTSNLMQNTRQIGTEFLAQFGIMTRATYKLINLKNVDLEYDDTLFKLIEHTVINEIEFIQIIISPLSKKQHISGYVVRTPNKQLHIRLEIVDGVVIIDLTNADLDLFRVLSDLLTENTPFNWSYLHLPTIYHNKESFLIFVGNANDNQMNKMLNEDFIWADKWYPINQAMKKSDVSKSLKDLK